MHTGLQGSCGFVRGKKGAKRQTACDRLGDRDYVGLDAVVLIGEPFARASKSALDLVDQEQRPASGGQCACSFQELAGDDLDSALALHSFNCDGADAVVELLLQIFDLIERDKLNSWKNWCIRISILRLARGRERSISTAMEGILHSQHAPLRLRSRLCGLFCVRSSNFQRAFPGFCSAVREKHAIESGDSRQSLSELAGELVIEEVRGVNQARRLLRDRLQHRA